MRIAHAHSGAPRRPAYRLRHDGHVGAVPEAFAQHGEAIRLRLEGNDLPRDLGEDLHPVADIGADIEHEAVCRHELAVERAPGVVVGVVRRQRGQIAIEAAATDERRQQAT